MAGNLKTHLANGRTWLRGLLIILFAILYGVAEIVVGAVVILQFGSQLITGAPMVRLLEFARGLNAYVYQILQFVTYRSEVRPFPLSPWPTHGVTDVAEAERVDAEQREAAREAERAQAERAARERIAAEMEQSDTAGTGSTDENKGKDGPQ